MYHIAGTPVEYEVQFSVNYVRSILGSVALVEVPLPALFVFLQLLDIPPLISTHSACLTW